MHLPFGIDAARFYHLFFSISHYNQVDRQTGTVPYEMSTHSSNLSNSRSGHLSSEICSGVDLDLQFEDLEFVQQDGGGALLGVGAVGSVYRASFRVGYVPMGY
jgi:hypothetical protein